MYKFNVVTRKIAVIFNNTYTGGLLDENTLVGGIVWSELKHKAIPTPSDPTFWKSLDSYEKGVYN